MSVHRWWRRPAVVLGVVAALSACGAKRQGSASPGGATAVSGNVPKPAGQSETSTDAGCLPCRDGRIVLREGWKLQSSARARAAGKEIAKPGFSTEGWYPVTVPSTVLAALVANGVYPDPYVGKNLLSIPQAPFNVSWWYRTEFTLPADFSGHAAWLDLDGINYRANVWLNGRLVASSKDLVGTFTTHEWNVTAFARAGEPNALAIEVFAPDPKKDLGLNWLDWNPAPPDHDMGIWRAAYIKKSGPVAVRGTRVRSQLDVAQLAPASLTIKTDLVNTTDRAVRTTVKATLETIEVHQDVDLSPRETRTVTFDPSQYEKLVIQSPRLWWPRQMGPQNQYDLYVRAEVDAKQSDVEPVRFGIRDVTFDLTDEGARVFRINGKRILIRGGGWAPDMMLRFDPERLGAELGYVADLGLNTIRLEGKLETDELYAMCDARGILVIPGWMCCDRWQKCERWTKTDHEIAAASMASEAARLRNHPSVIDFLIGSDEAPPPDVEKEFLDALRRADWPNPISPAASKRKTAALGPSGFKMTGPYDWVAPVYWYRDVDHRTEKGIHGGAFGFNSETGPGPAIPELESLRAALDAAELEELWSKPTAKHFHAGTLGKMFDNLSLFNEALAARHGKPKDLEDYVRKAQLMNYEAERAIFEAFGRNKYAPATGVIHWMLNNAWPSLIWHLYGQDLAPAGGYFGAKKANEALHIQYSYDDHSVVVVNHTPGEATGLSAAIHVYNRDGTEKLAQEKPVAVAPDAVTRVTTIPPLDGLSGVYFVKLDLLRGDQPVSSNLYWLSRKQEVVDFDNTEWYYAPTSQFADYAELAQLPEVDLVGSAAVRSDGERGEVRVTLTNPSSTIAFFIRLHLTDGKKDIVPVTWEDNYVSLLPKERRELVARYRTKSTRGARPAVEIGGWNVRKRMLAE
jgi:exo-1,4-beta-D-glucosaminidase